MHVLVVEDDASTRQSLEMMLAAEGFAVQSTGEGEDGFYLARWHDFDIVLLDINLPDVSGFDVLRRLRAARVRTPVLIVSGLAGIEDKVKGLALGADDYLVKPFHRDELVARMHSVVRRSHGLPTSVVECGPLSVDLAQRLVAVDGQPVHLTLKEYATLELLALRAGKVVSKEMFMNHLYGGLDEPEAKIVDVMICKLRRKIEAACGLRLIETEWGRGYVLRAPAAAAA